MNLHKSSEKSRYIRLRLCLFQCLFEIQILFRFRRRIYLDLLLTSTYFCLCLLPECTFNFIVCAMDEEEIYDFVLTLLMGAKLFSPSNSNSNFNFNLKEKKTYKKVCFDLRMRIQFWPHANISTHFPFNCARSFDILLINLPFYTKWICLKREHLWRWKKVNSLFSEKLLLKWKRNERSGDSRRSFHFTHPTHMNFNLNFKRQFKRFCKWENMEINFGFLWHCVFCCLSLNFFFSLFLWRTARPSNKMNVKN